MITSKQIIESLAVPKDDDEVALTLAKMIRDWLKHGQGGVDWKLNYELSQSLLIYIKRNVPNYSYSGKAYRMLWLNTDELIKDNLISTDKDKLFFTTKQVRTLLSKNKKYLSKMTSWSKTLSGVSAAGEAMSWRDSSKTIKMIISDYVTGVDIEKAYNFVVSLHSPDAFYPYLMDLKKYVVSQQEVIAPFNPTSFQVVSITTSI